MRKYFHYLFLFLTVGISFTSCEKNEIPETSDSEKQGNDKTQILAYDGAWCWFSDPRAIYYSSNEIVTGWVKKDGSVEAASFQINEEKIQLNTIYSKMQKDDHDNPAFAILPDGNIFTMYAWHGGTRGVISNTTTNGIDVFSFSGNNVFKPKNQNLLEEFPRETYTYANPYVLSGEENKLISFGRWIGFKPNMIISSDNGKTWDEQYVVVSRAPFESGNRPYAKYYSNGNTKIHMIFTDGHPRNETLNGVYYCYYENRAFWKADGSKICNLNELPFEPIETSVVYRPNLNSGRAWICDISEKDGIPYILYTRHPKETDHRYHYAWYDKASESWKDSEICKAGKWFPQTPAGQTEREPHYMGNMTLNPNKPNTIYLSRQVNGIFEIEKYHSKDGGLNWESEPITSSSVYDNVRPYIPRNMPDSAKTIVLWMESRKYIHYTDYDTNIRYYIENKD
jgi:hypothetical protein